MTLRSVILEAFRDEMTGDVGLGLADMRRDETTNAAVGSEGGVMIAHDLIEHVNGAGLIGTIDDELEALGAIWFVRGQFEDLNRYRDSIYSAHENISSDVARMFRDFVEGGQYVDLSPPRTRACEADDDLNEILEDATRSWHEDMYETEKGRAAWPQYRAACLARMRIGYRKARAKYKSAREANNLFWAIADAVNPCTRNAYEGARCELRYGFEGGNAVAYCEPQYDESED